MKEDTYSKHTEYKEICERAAVDETFNNFKNEKHYRSMLEHAHAGHGNQHLEAILKQTPELIEYFEKFRTNDTVGNPSMHDFKDFGKASPTTVQYARVLSDLILYFGNMDGLKIVEIGAGYGGQCKIISEYVNFSEYICFEMTEPAKLVQRYIDHFDIKNAVSMDAYAFLDNPYEIKCDLIISCFAFSEQSTHVQDPYLQYVINPSDRGYLWMNEAGGSHGIEGIRHRLTHEISEKGDISNERNSNRILYWGNSE